MPALHPCRHIGIAIARDPQTVYRYISDARNMPQWATSTFLAVRPDGDRWRMDTPQGEVSVRFAPPNDLGVADHEVTLPSGQTVRIPIRVIPNAEGSELVFTLFRLPGMSDEDFEADAANVLRDLASLKRLLDT